MRVASSLKGDCFLCWGVGKCEEEEEDDDDNDDDDDDDDDV